jgi:flagellar motor switch protein FliN/FliY
MAEFTAAEMPQVLAACQENLAGIAEGFNQCFLTQSRLSLGELNAWSADSAPSDLSGPGLLLTFQFGAVFVHIALPQSLPLPDWCREPGVSEVSRLQTLPVEWSINVFPMDFEAESSTYQYVEDLFLALRECEPAADASFFKVAVGEALDVPGFSIVGPCAKTYTAPALPGPEPVHESPAAATPPTAAPSWQDLSPEAAYEQAERARRVAHVMNMPVPIIVVMAEKKIGLGKLLTMGPGTIISFDKSCDDLLDLCVNNRAICSGEAVKIGEKFGLKINELQSTADRLKTMSRSRVL